MISSGWWSNVITAGRASAAAGLRARGARSRYRWPQVEPVEHPDRRRRRRPVGRLERLEPAARRRIGRRPRRAGRRGRDGSRVDGTSGSVAGRSASTLCGCSAPVTARQTATIAPVRPDGEARAARRAAERRLAGRVNSPSPRRRISSVGDRRVREVLQAGVDRAQQRGDPGRTVGRVLAQGLERDGVLQPERRPTPSAPARRGRRPSPRRAPEVAGERADVRAGRARDVDDRDRAGRIRVVPLEHRQLVDRHVARRELHGLARPAPSA